MNEFGKDFIFPPKIHYVDEFGNDDFVTMEYEWILSCCKNVQHLDMDLRTAL